MVADGSAPARIALHEVPDPVPAPGEVLVDVRAFSINRGEMRMLRTANDGWRPGWDFAGILRSDLQDGLKAGSRVVGIRRGGSWAEQVTVPEAWIAELPDAVSFAQGATLPAAGLAALRMLRTGTSILGRRVLVTGASGGVGRFAIQLAHLAGAEVTALVSTGSARADGLRELGADVVVSDVDQLRGRFDLILESVGGETLGRLVTKIDPQGTLIMFGNSSDEPTTFNVRDVYNDALVRLQGFELFFGGDPFGRDLGYLASLVADAKLDPQLAAEFPWERIAEAIDRLQGRQVAGKIALTLGPIDATARSTSAR
ncbi:MAG: zinc-binding dehydrogenase [Chloroflexota bacterium]